MVLCDKGATFCSYVHSCKTMAIARWFCSVFAVSCMASLLAIASPYGVIMGFGQGFGSIPYGFQAPTSASGDPVRLHSASYINPITGQHEFESDGEIRPMKGPAQRVLLTVARVMRTATRTTAGLPANIDNALLAKVRQDLAAALDSTLGDTLTLLTVEAGRNAAGSLAVEVTFKDNGTGEIETAKASL